MIRSPSAPARLTGARGKSIMASRLVKVGRPTVPGPTLSALTKYLFCLLPAALRPSLFQSLAFLREGQTLILGLPNTRTYPCLALTSVASPAGLITRDAQLIKARDHGADREVRVSQELLGQDRVAGRGGAEAEAVLVQLRSIEAPLAGCNADGPCCTTDTLLDGI